MSRFEMKKRQRGLSLVATPVARRIGSRDPSARIHSSLIGTLTDEVYCYEQN